MDKDPTAATAGVKPEEPASEGKSKTRFNTRRPPPNRKVKEERKVDQTELDGLHNIVVMALMGARMFVPQRYQPTREEIDRTLIPLERIYLRHADVPAISEDAQDAFAVIIGLAGYATRVVTSAPPRKPAAPPPPPPPTSYETPGTAANGAASPPPPPPDVGDESRWAEPGESVGVPAEQLAGAPDDVLRSLWQATYREDAAAQ